MLCALLGYINISYTQTCGASPKYSLHRCCLRISHVFHMWFSHLTLLFLFVCLVKRFVIEISLSQLSQLRHRQGLQREVLCISVCRTNQLGRRKSGNSASKRRTVGQHQHVIKKKDSTGSDGATHQVLVTESSELLKLLRYEELSTADCTADCPQH